MDVFSFRNSFSLQLLPYNHPNNKQTILLVQLIVLKSLNLMHTNAVKDSHCCPQCGNNRHYQRLMLWTDEHCAKLQILGPVIVFHRKVRGLCKKTQMVGKHFKVYNINSKIMTEETQNTLCGIQSFAGKNTNT